MFTFKEFLKEYRKAPLGQKFSKASVLNLLADTDHAHILRTHVAIDGIDFVFIEYDFDSANKMFAVVNRLRNEEVAAYMIIKKFGIGWQVQDVAVYDIFRNKGLGIDLYVKILETGIKLISGCSLSNEAEKIWTTKLPKHVQVRVYNKASNEISEFSDLPKLENGSDDSQVYFYIASSDKNELSENYSADDGFNNLLYENWIRNVGYQMRSYRSSKYGEEGEF